MFQELRSVSARELEACRRELEEEASRQRQHFLEEAELLKVQSEERLQDRINLLKVKSCFDNIVMYVAHIYKLSQI